MYLGGTLITGSDTPTAVWDQRGASVPALSLFNWFCIDQWAQHVAVAKSYEGAFLGLAQMYSVLKVTEFGNSFFIWNDVEYSVKACIWSGNVIEISSLFTFGSITPPTLKANTLPTEDGNTTIISGGVATNPGGDAYELQLNDDGEFGGSTGITFDVTSNRLLKGGTLPLIEYTRQTVTLAAGAVWVPFPVGTFLSGDDIGMDSAISGLTLNSADPEIIWAAPYGITFEGFYINFHFACTTTYSAFIKR